MFRVIVSETSFVGLASFDFPVGPAIVQSRFMSSKSNIRSSFVFSEPLNVRVQAFCC